jgi:branched-chain amino acid transport system substrate-binding protein
MRSAGVEAVLLNSSGEVAERFVADCAKQNYRPMLVSPGQSFEDKLYDNANYDGAYLANDSFNWFGDDPAATEFLAAMKSYRPKTQLNVSATAGWAAGVMFGKAAASVGAAPTSAEIYTGLYAQPARNTLGGLAPPITYAKDKPAVVEPCGWYGQLKDGKAIAPHGSAAVCVGK